MDVNSLPEWQKAQKGELFHAFIPELVAVRDRTYAACNAFNDNRDLSRRNVAKLWRDVTMDGRPLPAVAPSQIEDDKLFADEPLVIPPIRADYGFNIKLGPGAMVNFNSTFIDTCLITIGARTLVGPNCCFFSGTHPIDPALRKGTAGPELGKPIVIEEDCWLGGNVIILPGITIGRGCSIGAGSVVTKDVPPFHVAAGNPARILQKIETAMDPSQTITAIPATDTVKEGTEYLLARKGDDSSRIGP